VRWDQKNLKHGHEKYNLDSEGFRSIENKKKFLQRRTRTSQDLIYEMQNNERERLDLHTLVDRTAETFR
jgi:hypothetical protein